MAKANKSSMRDRVRQRTEETEHGGGGTKFELPESVKFFTPTKGTSELDIIPYVISDPRHPEVLAGRSKVGDLIDSRTIWVHGFVGAEEKSYICLKSIGKPCPLCEAQIALSKNSQADPEEVKQLKARERQVFNVIDLGEKNAPIMIWEFSYHLFGKKLEEEQRENEDYYGYAELENGYTLRVRFAEKTIGKSKPFLEASRIDFVKREAYEDSILDEVVDIDACLKIMSYEQLDKIYNGIPDVEPEEDERPKRGERTEEKSSRRRAPEPDEEEDEKPARSSRRSAPEPEEEEEKPARRSSRATKPEPEEEEEEPKPSRSRRSAPEPEPDEEEEEKPKSRRSAPEKEDTVHKHAEPTKPGKHEVDPDQDCPGGGKFGVDTDKLDGKNGCDSCDNWDDCRDEKDAKARAAKAPAGKRGK